MPNSNGWNWVSILFGFLLTINVSLTGFTLHEVYEMNADVRVLNEQVENTVSHSELSDYTLVERDWIRSLIKEAVVDDVRANDPLLEGGD